MSRVILVAEDDEFVREFLVAGLRGAGFDTQEAIDGPGVLTHLAGPPPALILLDLHMPVIDGLGVLRRLREADAWADTPVLFLTASSAVDDIVAARRLGARGYIIKPVRLPVLIERVTQVIEDPKLLWIDDITVSRRD